MSTPDYQASVRFLEWWSPDGPWVLAAIEVDRKGIATKTFRPEDEDELRRWLGEQGQTRNIYFHVNPVIKDLESKALRKDIKELAWLHVDVDPRADEDVKSEQERALKLLKEPPDGIPVPSCIIFSGGGYQGFWRLKDALPINGEEAAYEDAKRYNIQLEIAFGGDNCHNVDRIMRLPGTINRPDRKKRTKGREEALAELIEHHDDRVYELSRFWKAPVGESRTGANTKFLAPPTKISDIDDLPSAVSATARVVIVQGLDPDNPTRFPSRSEALFYVCCEMVRGGCMDGTILGVITDPAWAISASVLEHGRYALKYAQRQVEQARDAVAKSGRVAPGTIEVADGELARILSEAENALVAAKADVFQRGAELVRPVRLENSNDADGVRRESGATVLMPLSEHRLVQMMADVAPWVKRIGKGKTKPVDPDLKYARHLLARAGEWRFRALRGVVRTPTLRSDGTVFQEPGYDAAARLIFDPAGVDFPAIPQSPSRADAEAGLAQLDPLLASFPFVTEDARAVVYAAVLTGLIRRSLPSAPLFAFDAPTAGSGKSLLAEVTGLIVTGAKPPMMSLGKSVEETEKRLSTVLRAGDPVLVLDNCDRPVEGDFLCSMLTQESVQARILCKSERVVMPTNCLVVATGNNLTMAGDVSRRSLVCRLDPGVERPDLREFDFCPRAMAVERRTALVVGALTALRAYLVADRPSPLAPMGSFGEWNVVREALVWLGYGDPVATRQAMFEGDPLRSELAELLTAWDTAFGEQPRTLGDVRDWAEKPKIGPLFRLLVEMSSRHDFNARTVGWRLRRHKDRVLGGLVLRQSGDSERGKLWRVERVGGRQMDLAEVTS